MYSVWIFLVAVGVVWIIVYHIRKWLESIDDCASLWKATRYLVKRINWVIIIIYYISWVMIITSVELWSLHQFSNDYSRTGSFDSRLFLLLREFFPCWVPVSFWLWLIQLTVFNKWNSWLLLFSIEATVFMIRNFSTGFVIDCFETTNEISCLSQFVLLSQ